MEQRALAAANQENQEEEQAEAAEDSDSFLIASDADSTE